MHNQKTIVNGAVNSTPTMNFDAQGRAICDFEVVVNRTRKDREPDPTYFHVSVSGKRVADCYSLLRIGDEVTVTGNVKPSAAINSRGEAAGSINLFALTVEFPQEVWNRKNN